MIAGYIVAGISVIGYATFGRHPAWLGVFPGEFGKALVAFYGISFRLFGEGQSWFLFAILTAYLCHKVGMKWLPAALVVYVVSLASELAGTLYGWPFGPYLYTSLLGPKWFAHVPYVIPATWWMMALPAYAMAYVRFVQPLDHEGAPAQGASWAVVLVGAFWLTLWDVSLDPAMSYLTKYWVWKEPVAYPFYGMPLQNWLGWYLTSLALMAVLKVMRIERWMMGLSVRWLMAFYFLNIFISLGMLTVAAQWPIVGINVLLLVGCFALLLPGDFRLRQLRFASLTNFFSLR